MCTKARQGKGSTQASGGEVEEGVAQEDKVGGDHKKKPAAHYATRQQQLEDKGQNGCFLHLGVCLRPPGKYITRNKARTIRFRLNCYIIDKSLASAS